MTAWRPNCTQRKHKTFEKYLSFIFFETKDKVTTLIPRQQYDKRKINGKFDVHILYYNIPVAVHSMKLIAGDKLLRLVHLRAIQCSLFHLGCVRVRTPSLSFHAESSWPWMIAHNERMTAEWISLLTRVSTVRYSYTKVTANATAVCASGNEWVIVNEQGKASAWTNSSDRETKSLCRNIGFGSDTFLPRTRVIISSLHVSVNGSSCLAANGKFRNEMLYKGHSGS